MGQKEGITPPGSWKALKNATAVVLAHVLLVYLPMKAQPCIVDGIPDGRVGIPEAPRF